MTDPQEALSIERLIVDYHAPLYRYAYRLTGQQADAEDLTQQTFLLAHQRLQQVRDPAKVGGWLYAVLRSCWLKGRQKAGREKLADWPLDMDEMAVDGIDEPIDREQLQGALGQLPDEFKLVLLAYYFEDCSYREIAERLEIPTGTVMSRLSRAKARLRTLLSDSPTGKRASANGAPGSSPGPPGPGPPGPVSPSAPTRPPRWAASTS